jgi:hypothetical protein
MADAPPLVKPLDKKIPQFTMYLKESLDDKAAAPKMGVFAPQDYKPTDSVDVLVYLHGHKLRIVKPSFSIEEIWDLPDFPVRRNLNVSGKQMILVAPTLGAASEFGDLASKGDSHLERVMAALRKYGPHDKFEKDPTVGRIILSSHSGGGEPMRQMVNGMKKYGKNITEVWGIDSMFGAVEDDWISIATSKEHAGMKMYFYYLGTKRRSQKVADMARKLKNVYVMEGQDIHDELVKKHFLDRLKRIGGDSLDDDAARQAVFKEMDAPPPPPKAKPRQSAAQHH